MTRICSTVITALLLSVSLFAGEQNETATLFNKDVSLAKRELVKMNITIEDSKKSASFWSIYDQYESESKKEATAYLAFLKKYSGVAMAMDSKVADGIAKELFTIQADRQKMLARIYKQLRAQISPAVAARFIQIENRLSILEDFQIASGFPMALPNGAGESKRVIEVTVE